jgi:hypothetical protein
MPLNVSPESTMYVFVGAADDPSASVDGDDDWAGSVDAAASASSPEFESHPAIASVTATRPPTAATRHRAVNDRIGLNIIGFLVLVNDSSWQTGPPTVIGSG